MALSEKQLGVMKGMLSAFLLALLLFAAAIHWLTLPNALDMRLQLAAQSLLFPALIFGISIGRLAKHRFFTPEDIDGSGLTAGTSQAKLLQALLQNTLEQLVLACAAYLVAAVCLPAHWLGLIPTAALCFVIGRVCFFGGYANGAASRAFGFALTFYPSMLLLAASLVWQLLAWFS